MKTEGKKSDFELILEAIDNMPEIKKMLPRTEDLRIIGDRDEFLKVMDKDNYRVMVEVEDFIEFICFFPELPYYVSTASAEGENNIYEAMKSALAGLPVNIPDVSRILFCITGSCVSAEDIGTIMSFGQELPEGMDVCWGTALDETWQPHHTKVTIVAAGKYEKGL